MRVQPGILSKAFKMSSITPIENPPVSISAGGGRVQVSTTTGSGTVGLLAERGESYGGLLLSPSQAKELARLLLDGARFS